LDASLVLLVVLSLFSSLGVDEVVVVPEVLPPPDELLPGEVCVLSVDELPVVLASVVMTSLVAW
jgi:hypothetical protein